MLCRGNSGRPAYAGDPADPARGAEGQLRAPGVRPVPPLGSGRGARVSAILQLENSSNATLSFSSSISVFVCKLNRILLILLKLPIMVGKKYNPPIVSPV